MYWGCILLPSPTPFNSGVIATIKQLFGNCVLSGGILVPSPTPAYVTELIKRKKNLQSILVFSLYFTYFRFLNMNADTPNSIFLDSAFSFEIPFSSKPSIIIEQFFIHILICSRNCILHGS